MFSTSTVRPPKCVMTSPGRSADPDGMFSAAATNPVTRDLTPSGPSADMAAITAAPPAMSVFISFMPSAGLSDSPPLSNVMPLPASTMCSWAPAGAYPSSIRRGGEADPDPTAIRPPNPCAASSPASHTRAVSPAPAATAAAWSASQAGVLRADGVFVRSRASATAPATVRAAATASGCPSGPDTSSRTSPGGSPWSGSSRFCEKR